MVAADPSGRRSASAGPEAPTLPGPDRPPLAAIAMLSAAALGYEVLLMRLFSIIQWHHFAAMMISVALLGYGMAGSFVALARRRLLERYSQVVVAAAALFGVLAVAGFLLAQRLAFNPLELLWDPLQPLRLAAVYALLLPPFFCAATALCLNFTRFGTEAPRVYSFDILGAGAGCLAIVGALFVLAPGDTLRAVGALGLLAAGVASWSLGRGLGPERRRRLAWAGLLAGLLALLIGLPDELFRLRPSPYKDLSQTLQIAGTRIVAERSSPLGLVTVVESPRVPFRHAPGLSLAAPAEPPPQLGVFVDGDGPSALTRHDGRREPLAYLDHLSSALPYHLMDHLMDRQSGPRVLVLGSGAGADVLQAMVGGARSIDAVELDPLVVDLVQQRFGSFSGRPYSAPGVRVHIGEARGFVARHGERFDLITVALLDAFGASSAGLYALAESTLYTTEAIGTYLDRLEPAGLLAITRWMQLPPRDTLKLVATAVVALERRGVADPGRQLALVRSWRTATLVVKASPFSAAEIAALRQFCRTRSFDVVHFPGITPGEWNRFNVIEPPDLEPGVQALLGPGRADFIERYKFAIEPATDDRPYFFRFFRWQTLPELLALEGQGGLALLEWGYPVLVATLLQALVASALLLLLPLVVQARRSGTRGLAWRTHGRVAIHFGALGLAFMFVEIAFIQRFVLFLAHPLTAVAVVLCAFLVFAGLGSRHAERLRPGARSPGQRPVGRAVAAIAALSLLYLAALPSIFGLAMPLPDAARTMLSIALIAPLAFAMGIPFPTGLARLARQAGPARQARADGEGEGMGESEAMIPWAWGVNAFASVVAAILATLLAIHLGFAVVVATAVLLYVAAAMTSP
jgi:hypothetical protein